MSDEYAPRFEFAILRLKCQGCGEVFQVARSHKRYEPDRVGGYWDLDPPEHTHNGSRCIGDTMIGEILGADMVWQDTRLLPPGGARERWQRVKELEENFTY